MDSLPVWAPYEEFWNAVTHGVMIPVSIQLTYKLVKQTLENSKLKSNPYNDFCAEGEGETEKNAGESNNNAKIDKNESSSEEKSGEQNEKEKIENKKSLEKSSNETKGNENRNAKIMEKIKKLSPEDLKKKQSRNYLYGNVDKQRIIGCIIYGICMIFLFVNSTIYHGSSNPKIKYFLRYLDHCTIYFQIAGTYTPILLTVMRKFIGYGLLAYAWTFAAIGIYTKIMYFDKTFGTYIYLAMGWSICFFLPAVKKVLTKKELLWLFYGGVSYTIGCVFFALQKYRPFMHTIFHLFVSGGALSHFRCIYLLAD